MSTCNVYIAKFPFPYSEDIFCLKRREEIENCRNSSVKEQKFYVWKLLEKALAHSFGLGISELHFEKKNNGKWVLDGYHFSLSHSGNVVVVALADSPLGIDIQKIKNLDESEKFKAIIFSKNEKVKYHQVNDEQLMKIWSLKECAYKKSDDATFIPHHYEVDSLTKFNSMMLKQADEKYILSLLSDEIDNVKYFSIFGDFKTVGKTKYLIEKLS